VNTQLLIAISVPPACVILGWYLNKKFGQKARLIAGRTNVAHIKMNEGRIVSNHTLIIRNNGSKEARNVTVMHLTLPDNYQVMPAIPYSIEKYKDGTGIVFPTLGPGEEVNICYMYPESLMGEVRGVIKHDEGQAEYINFLLTREWPPVALRVIRIFIGLGIIYSLTWAMWIFLKIRDYIQPLLSSF
jgi:hypothetical protein